MIPLISPLVSLWDGIVDLFNLIMTPLYHGVSLLLVGWYKLLSPVFGENSGWTWALSIAGLTIVIRTLLIPLFVKQIRSSRNLQLLQPKMKELQKKYGHDRERLGQEMMKMYKETGTNPFSSCMPLLLQSPIFLALFRVLDQASHGKSLSQFFKDYVPSLESAHIFGAEISATFLRPGDAAPTNVKIVAMVLTVLMTATMFITQLQLMRKNMPKEALEGQAAQMQKIMLYVFPIFFFIGGFNFPIGVLIYWLVSNLWTMGQQFYVIRRNPAPGTPAYDAMQERKKAHAQKTGQPIDEPSDGDAAAVETAKPTGPRQQPKRQPRSARKGTPTGGGAQKSSPAAGTAKKSATGGAAAKKGTSGGTAKKSAASQKDSTSSTNGQPAKKRSAGQKRTSGGSQKSGQRRKDEPTAR